VVTDTIPVEFSPLPTTREERGRQIAQLGGIRPLGARYAVPSQSVRSDAPPTYLVDLVEQTCTCPDFELRRLVCKHQEAVLFWLAWEGTVNEHTGEVVLPKKRKTYKQNWPRKPGAGRNPIPLRDAVFATVMKVYTTLSGRRASTDIERCEERGHLGRAVHCSSVFRTMEDPATTPILVRLIEEAAAPLAEIENAAGQFAQDSTGFSTVTYDRWFDQAHGKLRAEHAWVKLHVMVGTVTNVVTGVKVSSEGDCPLLPALLAQTAKTFRVREVSADKAYLKKKNLAAIEAVGAVPFIPFKSNSVGMRSKSEPWKRMWCYFTLKSEEFRAHYHRRSNVESTMWMIKSKFGGSVRSRLPTAQANEVLAKVLCHNLTCIVHAVAEFGIDVGFGKPLVFSEHTSTSCAALQANFDGERGGE